jgi:hypothetical protein
MMRGSCLWLFPVTGHLALQVGGWQRSRTRRVKAVFWILAVSLLTFHCLDGHLVGGGDLPLRGHGETQAGAGIQQAAEGEEEQEAFH